MGEIETRRDAGRGADRDEAISARLDKQYPDTNAGVSAIVKPLLENLVGGYRKNLTLLLSAVGLVLLIACANLANLFAARGAARAREFAIRAAVGASRGRIVRQLLIESAIVALLGGALGFLIALWSRDALVALGPAGVGRFHEISFDGRVLGFTFALAALTSVLFGLWPAWGASRADVQLALKSGSTQASDSRSARRSRDLLVIGEVALTLILLSSAALVMKSFARAQALALGYEPRNLLTARIDLAFANYGTSAKVATFSNALLDKVRALPGVNSASIGSNPPQLSGWQVSFFRDGIGTPSAADQPNAESEVVASDYFVTLKAPILSGRGLDRRDTANAPLAVVIDQSLAARYFPGEDPLGNGFPSRPTVRRPTIAGIKSWAWSGGCNTEVLTIRLRFPHFTFHRARCNGPIWSCWCVRRSATLRWKNQSVRSAPPSIPPSPFRCAPDDGTRAGNLGSATASHISALDFCRPCASPCDDWFVWCHRLHSG